MKLNEKPKILAWPATHYVFIEKKGPFHKTAPLAWGKLHQAVPNILENNRITGYLAMYKAEAGVYRAGVSLSAPGRKLPAGFKSTKFKGGKYSCFVLKGPYSDLPEACGRVFEIVEKKPIKMRKDFCIEHYKTDPRVTPEDKTVTEILIPTA
ncbi:MAG TPA: GyrI-like domain-containing protein [bacterium]|nr:GyrI-like domain-containing protein [bacterium]